VSLDARAYRGRYPGDLLVAFARDLLGAVGALDAVGGDVVVASLGRLPPVALVRHPDLVRDVFVGLNDRLTKARGLRLAKTLLGEGLLTSEPPHHTRQRRLLLPAFHHTRLRLYARAMVDAATAEADTWRDGATVDAAAAMNRLALVIAGRTLFSADVLVHADRVGGAVAEAMAAFDRSQFPMADRLMWLPTPARHRADRARATLDALVYNLIARRRTDGVGAHDDLLDMLLAARDEETGAAMSDTEVRDEAMTLLLAGHETTAVALAWAWAALAEQPDAEAALHAEVDALGRPPTFDDVPRLPVTRAVVAETMRLWPPAWVVGREAAAEVTLGAARLPRGTTILFAPYFIHRDARFWPDPSRFDLARFMPDADSREPARHKFAYVPFSAGRRGCIGERFAWTEAVLVLATLAQRWRLVPAGPRPAAQGSVTLRPAGPMPMRAEARHRGVTPPPDLGAIPSAAAR